MRNTKFRLAIYRANDLLSPEVNLAPRDPVVSLAGNAKEHVICGRDMVEVFAPRGVGKSMFALGLGLSIATKCDYLAWRINKPRKVLYIDGEMPGYMIQERMRAMAARMDKPSRRLLSNFSYAARDWQGQVMPRLDTPEGEAAVERLVDPKWSNKDEEILLQLDGPRRLIHWGATVVILDNAACLFDPEGEKDGAAWRPAQDWLLKLRDRGVTTILVHHAGKSGEARGHSSKEDAMDTIISLRHPQGYKARMGAKFIVDFTKGRSLFGDAADPFLSKFNAEDGWTWEPLGAKKKSVKAAKSALHEAIKDYVRAHDGCTSTRIETRVKGGTKPIREALSKLLTARELKKYKNGGFSCV